MPLFPERFFSSAWWLRTGLSGILLGWLGFHPAWAQTTPDTNAVLDEVKGFLGDAFDVGIWILIGGGYLAAGYMIILGAWKFFHDREGGLAQFLMGIAVALGMVILMTFFVTTGQDQIGNL